MYENVSITNLIPGNLYTFKVSAVGGYGVLGKVSVLSEYTVPNVTNTLSISDASINSISLSWLPPTGNKSFYLVQVLGNPASNVTTFIENVSITNLIPGNNYIFLVSAVSGNGVLGISSTIAEFTVNGRISLSLQFSTNLPENERKAYILSQLQQKLKDRFVHEKFTLLWKKESVK
ncbi:receptor-type tyrosine-protein phosphatase eta-like [Lissotriton helveticus]